MNNENTSIPIDFIKDFPVRVGASSVNGRGIFATQDISEGQVIERCPMVPLGFRSRYHSDPQIYRYVYAQPLCPCKECSNHGFILHMVLGYGMLYNHQDNPNTEWKFDYPNLIADVVAIRDIKKDDEIFVDYGKKYFNNPDEKKIELSDAENYK